MIVDLLFNIINVILLLALGIYAFKRYMLPSVKQALQDYYNYKVMLDSKKDSLIEEQEALIEATKNQGNECKNLKDKIHSWEQHVDDVHAKNYEEKKAFFKAIEQRVKLQTYNYAQVVFAQKITPRVKSLLTDSLHDYFSNLESKQIYQDQIIKYIKKN